MSHDPGVLRSTALRRVHDERSVAQRDAREPPGNEVHRPAGEHVWSEVDVPRGEPCVNECRTGRQGERWLRNVFLRLRDDAAAERLALGRTRRRADKHAVTARTVHFLDHQLREMVEAVTEIVVDAKLPRRYVV